MILDTDHCYYMYMLYGYDDTSHSYFVFMPHLYIKAPLHIVTWILGILLLHMHVWFLYSCHMDSRSYYMYYCSMLPYSCYMIVSCYWYGYSRYWIWELLICDMWIPTSIVPVSLYIVPVFPLYCSMLSTELRSYYHVTHIMYCSCSCYIVYLTYQIIKLTWVWERLDGWLDLIGWCTGSILFSHCRGW